MTETAAAPKIRTRDEAVGYVESLLRALVACRSACDTAVIVGTKRTAQEAYAKFLVKQAQTLEACALLFCVGLYDEVAYRDLRARAEESARPTVR